jgi:hypothetical protein
MTREARAARMTVTIMTRSRLEDFTTRSARARRKARKTEKEEPPEELKASSGMEIKQRRPSNKFAQEDNCADKVDCVESLRHCRVDAVIVES